MKRYFAFLLCLSLIFGLYSCSFLKKESDEPLQTGIWDAGAAQPPREQTPPAQDQSQAPTKPAPAVLPRQEELLGDTAVSITRPEVQGGTAAAEIINQYFTMLSGKVLDYAEGDLSPMPGVTYSVTAAYELTYATDQVLSFLWTVDTVTSSPEFPESTAVSAATFDGSTGNLLTFSTLFGSHVQTVRNLFAVQARKVIAAQSQNHYYFEAWQTLADTALDTDCFYLTEEGVCVFYPREALGTYTEVTLSYAILANYLTFTP